MNKQFSRNYRRNKEKTDGRYRVVILLSVVLLISAVLGVGWAEHRQAQHHAALQAFSVRVSAWWTERKTRIATQLIKPKEKIRQTVAQPKAKSSAPEPVHFEFYSMLPNNGAPVESESTPTIFNHDNLEREFAKTVTKTAYVIQAGTYSNLTLADKTRDTLVQDGLATKIIKSYIDERLVYRIQVGPYQEKDEINTAQSKLAARGIHGVLRKTEEKIA